ncbi:hypothetical protein PR048_015582 [Dryococelus australis]|uniref:Bro-N domain-containing protein n=1 Tax=Dryococelus australis TaxID=614101 RepID=A0ABQ9HHD0_9NEOP|nr:hypothetical protein PR048_015582 [Dryococelus australis]
MEQHRNERARQEYPEMQVLLSLDNVNPVTLYNLMKEHLPITSIGNFFSTTMSRDDLITDIIRIKSFANLKENEMESICNRDKVVRELKGKHMYNKMQSLIDIVNGKLNCGGREVYVIIDEEGNQWCKAKDIALILEYTNTDKVIRNHVREKYRQSYADIGVNDLFTPLNMQPHAVFINEPGLYALIMKSKMVAAEQFQDWVYEEVLPFIRKHGEYKIEQKYKPLLDDLNKKLTDANDMIDKCGLPQTEDIGKNHRFVLIYTGGICYYVIRCQKRLVSVRLDVIRQEYPDIQVLLSLDNINPLRCGRSTLKREEEVDVGRMMVTRLTPSFTTPCVRGRFAEIREYLSLGRPSKGEYIYRASKLPIRYPRSGLLVMILGREARASANTDRQFVSTEGGLVEVDRLAAHIEAGCSYSFSLSPSLSPSLVPLAKDSVPLRKWAMACERTEVMTELPCVKPPPPPARLPRAFADVAGGSEELSPSPAYPATLRQSPARTSTANVIPSQRAAEDSTARATRRALARLQTPERYKVARFPSLLSLSARDFAAGWGGTGLGVRTFRRLAIVAGPREPGSG